MQMKLKKQPSEREKKCDLIAKAMAEIFLATKVPINERSKRRSLHKSQVIAEICFLYGLNVNYIKKLGRWRFKGATKNLRDI